MASIGNRVEVIIGHCIDDDMRYAFCAQLIHLVTQYLRTPCHNMPIHEADGTCDLWFEQAHQVRIPHRRQRMILHRAFGQRLFTDKQIAHENRSTIFGERRAI